MHCCKSRPLDNVEYERILREQIELLGGRLGSITIVLGCITDREAAVQLAFNRLEKKYHWMINLVCQVSCVPFEHGIAMLQLWSELVDVGTWLQPIHQKLVEGVLTGWQHP